ncbi:aminodeoxychorismate synthase component I [methane-oxidizing endosymbiont of Gigantopelta aegis]|uniref:aminodeoxychorismate synthase component I n=1 Tax=methane-oxidizing endosymbiont of Gigantopelta aegis TaxID=2794938 RepID=UPI0018DCA166|nr:aminodeoxychorismate synthase component I [methane-oxidizing endosymbiont of Gigantopelta aegis]
MTAAKLQIHPLPYFPDSADLFSAIANKPWAIFLDSGYPITHQGRFDIIACDPVVTLETRGQKTTIKQQGEVLVSEADPFALVKQFLDVSLSSEEDLPFNGGAIGYFSYDLARRLEKLPEIAEDAEQIPEMAVGIYHWAVIVDHHKQQTHLIGHHLSEDVWETLIDQFSLLPAVPQDDSFSVLETPVSNMDRDYYAKAFDKIQHYLKEGDCYQVNLAQRFSAPCQGNLWLAYRYLRQINAAPFSSYINLPDVQVLSSSPERFLSVNDGEVETKPIKGTRSRKFSEQLDVLQIGALIESRKDRAENVMIVDLLRNDISKCCKPGSVKVPRLFDIESYATVHHLVSTVKGELKHDQHALDLLRSCFPGGSITGAPKIRAMEIIEELEPHRRGVYCGSIGYIGFNGNMDTNIAIRTLVHSDGCIRLWAGGGIVNDSSMEEEYQESFDKAAALLNVLAHFKAS